MSAYPRTKRTVLTHEVPSLLGEYHIRVPIQKVLAHFHLEDKITFIGPDGGPDSVHPDFVRGNHVRKNILKAMRGTNKTWCAVLNTQSVEKAGSHWVSLWVQEANTLKEKGIAFFFDSFGLPIAKHPDIRKVWAPARYYVTHSNTVCIQAGDYRQCGPYSIWFIVGQILLYRSYKGPPPRPAFKQFELPRPRELNALRSGLFEIRKDDKPKKPAFSQEKGENGVVINVLESSDEEDDATAEGDRVSMPETPDVALSLNLFRTRSLLDRRNYYRTSSVLGSHSPLIPVPQKNKKKKEKKRGAGKNVSSSSSASRRSVRRNLDLGAAEADDGASSSSLGKPSRPKRRRKQKASSSVPKSDGSKSKSRTKPKRKPRRRKPVLPFFSSSDSDSDEPATQQQTKYHRRRNFIEVSSSSSSDSEVALPQRKPNPLPRREPSSYSSQAAKEEEAKGPNQAPVLIYLSPSESDESSA